MNKMLRFELRKLFRSPVFYFCILAIVMGNLMNIAVYKLMEAFPVEIPDDMGMGVTELLTMSVNGSNMLMNGILNSSLISVLSIFSALFICEDFGNNTAKNILAHGYTRSEMVLSKLISTTVGSLLFGAIALLTGFLFGWVVGGKIGPWDNNLILYIIGQLVGVIAFNAIYAVMAFTFRKAAPTIAVTLLSSSFIPLILKGLGSVFEIKGFNLEMASLSNAIMNIMKVTYSSKALTTALICSAVYLVIGIISCFLVFRKKDI